MFTDRNLKGLKETPTTFGVRGRYIMLMVAMCMVVSFASIVIMVMLFFAKNFVFGFLMIPLWIIGVILVMSIFRYLSVQKEYKNIKKRAEIISNKDLIDYL